MSSPSSWSAFLGLASEATQWIKLNELQSLVEAYPDVFLGVAILQCALLGLYSILVISISNRAHRRKLESISSSKALESLPRVESVEALAESATVGLKNSRFESKNQVSASIEK